MNQAIRKQTRNNISKTVGLFLLIFAVANLAHARNNASKQMGTWKLNEAKSKLVSGMTKNQTVIYTTLGNKIMVTVDGADPAGKPTHNEWTGKFNGKDYPVIGDPATDSRSYRVVDDHTLDLTNKKGGKVTTTARVVVSADGKSRTITVHGKDVNGKKFTSVGVYDKG
ncbi:MAG: hypothetical protein ACREIF_01135 [Chthoniobacterales bacterium]